jgi:hypothetical protein
VRKVLTIGSEMKVNRLTRTQEKIRTNKEKTVKTLGEKSIPILRAEFERNARDELKLG